jgi:four helix bundle protein
MSRPLEFGHFACWTLPQTLPQTCLALRNKRHAVVDQLYRAAESIILNIAEAARLRHLDHKQQFFDYASGSALECAACLDIAVVKQLLLREIAAVEKQPESR